MQHLSRTMPVFLLCILTPLCQLIAQSRTPVETASLHVGNNLVLQRSSPAPQKLEGPVLYQLLLNASGAPGTVPVFDSNPRHLTNSPITVGGGNVAIGGLLINGGSGVISFAGSQSFAGDGSGLTNLNGANVTGAVGNALLLNGVSTYARTDLGNSFTSGTQAIQTGAPGTVGLVVQGANAQSAHLQDWKNNGGTAVASVSAGGVISGTFSGDGSGLTNLSSSQLVGGGINPQQVALLKWYAANQTGITYAVGVQPNGLAFDGANIWVTNNISNNVSKLRASDGAVLGNFGVGNSPQGVAFDGANIWVANILSNTVSKLRASDGAFLGNFGVGTNPYGVAFDGASIWVTNYGSNDVTKLRASDGAALGTFSVHSNGPNAVAFDGANIWVTNNNLASNSVSKLRASDGAFLGIFPVPASPTAIAFDGANMWVANNNNSVSKLRASDGAPQPGSPFAVGAGPQGVAFDGANIWVTNNSGNTVSKLRASDGAVLGTFAVGSGPSGVAFDGANIWVADQGSNTVSKL